MSQPIASNEGRPKPEGALRAATYNIRHGLGDDSVLDLARIRDVIRLLAPDFLFLQEVDSQFPRSFRIPQARWLSEELSMHFAYENNYQVSDLYGMGNAVLSRTEIHSTWNTTLPYTTERRGLIQADTEWGGRSLRLASTHWGLFGKERARQAQACADALESCRSAVLLGGDLNAEPTSPEVALLTRPPDLTDYTEGSGPTYPLRNAAAKIDYVLGRGFTCVSAWTQTEAASDHRLVACDLMVSG